MEINGDPLLLIKPPKKPTMNPTKNPPRNSERKFPNPLPKILPNEETNILNYCSGIVCQKIKSVSELMGPDFKKSKYFSGWALFLGSKCTLV